MADNVQSEAVVVAGTNWAADDISSVFYPRTKVVIGADGTSDGDVSSSNPMPIKKQSSSTGTRTQVADTASDTLILASSSSRLGAVVFNDSTDVLYLGLGTTTVSSTNYTVKLYPNGCYHTPDQFTGQIRGIWATDPGTGAARVTELTA
jgi:hypothetical protein